MFVAWTNQNGPVSSVGSEVSLQTETSNTQTVAQKHHSRCFHNGPITTVSLLVAKKLYCLRSNKLLFLLLDVSRWESVGRTAHWSLCWCCVVAARTLTLPTLVAHKHLAVLPAAFFAHIHTQKVDSRASLSSHSIVVKSTGSFQGFMRDRPPE